MTALASTDVTITVQKKLISGKRKRNRVKIAFGNGTLTYPSGGVPMPAFGLFGMKRFLNFLALSDGDDGVGIIWKYDQENNKLRGYIGGIVVGAAGAVTVDDFPLDTSADPMATAVSLSLTNSTGAGTKYLGKLIELGTSHAPPASVLYAEAVGW